MNMAISDDAIYAGLLVISIPFGQLIKSIDSCARRQIISTLAGIIIVISVSGIHSLHSILTTLVNCLIIKTVGPKRCHIVSFIWCFGYIVFFRTTTYFGLPSVPPHANAVQLILTLKLVGLAFEIHDSHATAAEAKKTEHEEVKEKLELQHRYQSVSPSLGDMLMYSYCYIGVLTGPYYRYRTYHDMMHERNTRHINTLVPLLHKLKWLPVYATSWVILSRFFDIKYTQTDEFYERPFWFRLTYMIPMFFIMRLRFYCAWYLAESMCVSAALGAYPAVSKPRIGRGPTDFKALRECEEKTAPEGIAYNFETIRNISPHGCEFATTVREAMKAWNMSVQYWLVNAVYRRLPFRSGPLRAAVTMFVSAFWHGVHPGYYLSFLTTIPSMLAEDLMAAAFRQGRSPRHQQLFDGLCWFVRCRVLDYMCMGFLLLTLHDTTRYWASIYYAGHLWTLGFIAIGWYFAPKRARGERKGVQTETEGEKKAQ